MRVRCVRLIDERTGSTIQASPWLTVGKTYTVLQIFISVGGAIKFRMIGDDSRTPALHHFSQFEIVSSVISGCWGANFDADSFLEIGPRAWFQRGFWEDYFEGRSEAVAVFERFRLQTIEDDPA